MSRSLMSLAVLVWLLVWGRAGLAQVDERFEVFFELEGLRCGGEIVAPAGTTLEIKVNVMFRSEVDGVTVCRIPVGVSGADDTALVGCADEDRACGASLIFGDEGSETNLFVYFVETVDPDVVPIEGPITERQGPGYIVEFVTQIIPPNVIQLPAGIFTVGQFKALVAVPQDDTGGVITVQVKNGLQGSRSPKSVLVATPGEEQAETHTPLSTPCTFTVIPGNPSVLPGDLNLDEVLDATDALALLDHYFRGEPSHLPCGDGTVYDPANLEFLDGNGDGAIDVSDAIYLLNNVFLGGPPHQSGAECTPIVGCPEVCSL